MNARALDAWGATGGVFACPAHAMPAAGELVDGRAKPGHDGREGGGLQGAVTGRRWEALRLLCAFVVFISPGRERLDHRGTEAQREDVNARALDAPHLCLALRARLSAEAAQDPALCAASLCLCASVVFYSGPLTPALSPFGGEGEDGSGPGARRRGRCGIRQGLTTEAQRHRGGGANLRALEAWGATGGVLARRAHAMPAAGELVDGRTKPGHDGTEGGALQGAAAGRRREALWLLCASVPLWFLSLAARLRGARGTEGAVDAG